MLQKIHNITKIIISLGFFNSIVLLLNEKLFGVKLVNLNRTKFKIPYPIHLRPGTSDFKVLKQIFVEEEYRINLGFVPSVIIDAGANIGLASIYFKNRFLNSKIICIEPDKENVEVLRMNLINYSNVHIHQAGLWSHKTFTKISDKKGMGKWAMIIEESTEQNTQINTITIPDLMEEYNISTIDVLKLDIETAEKELFSKDYMIWLPKVKVVIIELHDWMLEGCSKPFFTAINQAFSKFHFSQIGENTVIINRDLLPEN